MAAQGGFGLTATINATTIVRILDAEFPKIKNFIAEATGHDATNGYYTAISSGKKRAETMKLTVAWNATDHAAILAGLGACHEAIVAGTRTEVQHRITRLDARELGRQSATQAQVRVRGVAFQLGIVVAHDVVHLCAASARAAAAAGVGGLVL